MSRYHVLLLGAVLGLVLAIVTGATPALASPADCPAGPTVDYTGSDDAAGQAHAGRLEAAQACHALADRLDAVDGDVKQLHTDLGGTLTVVCSGCGTAGATGPQGTDGDPTYVRFSSQDATNAQIDSAATLTHDDLFILIGALLGGTVLVFVLNRVWP